MDAEFSYWQRVDRNIGIIGYEDQRKLKHFSVAIAGCGGMGGLIAERLARAGIGKLILADGDKFEISNLNRQFASNNKTLGMNKALSVRDEICKIAPECAVSVFTDGVTAKNAADFVRHADIVCDEIEFFQIAGRVHLHRAARSANLRVLNCNVVGFGTRIFLFTPNSMTMEEFLEVKADTKLDEAVISRLVCRLAPELPKYISQEVIQDWVFKKHKAPIFGTTPALSAGVVSTRVVLELLGYDAKPDFLALLPMPAYLAFDCANFRVSSVMGKWW